MGIKVDFCGTSYLVTICLLLISIYCDTLINCESIHTLHRNNIENIDADFKINRTELDRFINRGLNFTKSQQIMANISQQEFFSKYKEYLSRINYRKRRSTKILGEELASHIYGDDDEIESEKNIFAFKHSEKSNVEDHSRKRRFTNEDDVVSLDFEIKERNDLPLQIEQSILSILIVNKEGIIQTDSSVKLSRQTGDSESDDDDDNSSGGDVVSKKFTLKPQNYSKKQRTRHQHGDRHFRSKGRVQVNSNLWPSIKIHVYRQMTQGRHHILSKEISVPINSDNKKRIMFDKWIQLDLTASVKEWLNEEVNILSIDILCEFCEQNGLKIVNVPNYEATNNNPALNIIGTVIRSKRKIDNMKKKSEKLGKVKDYTVTQPKKTFCKQNEDKKCCRHKWIIDFKELGGYEFIIEPRKFDAGFCEGNCPYRFNVGNNHAFFQSLARHQTKNSKIPNVCCAPTRFENLEFLHVDEDDNTKLKVTTMKKMKAIKCSCT